MNEYDLENQRHEDFKNDPKGYKEFHDYHAYLEIFKYSAKKIINLGFIFAIYFLVGNEVCILFATSIHFIRDFMD